MSSKNKNSRGVTLIEIIVVIAILGLILGMSMLVHLDLFKGDIFRSEENTIVSLLEKARSQSMANLNDNTHGVCLSGGKYYLFETTCTSGEAFSANSNITFTPSFPTIVFDRLTGNTSNVSFTMTDGIKSATITLNNEGTIIW